MFPNYRSPSPALKIGPWPERLRLLVALLAMLMGLALGAGNRLARAAETVVISGANGASVKRSGEIIDYTGRGLTLRLAGGVEEFFPANAIFEVQTTRVAEHARGLELLAAGDPMAAIEKFRLAGKLEQRRWVQRELLAGLTRGYAAAEQWEKAGATFLVLVRNDPETIHFAAIPLAWLPGEPAPALAKVAQTWLTRENEPVAQLLGASWLLSSANRGESVAQLKKLTANGNALVARLAETQLWRTQLVSATNADAARWPAVIEKLPASLRAGPYFLLGKAQGQLQQPSAAALTFLRVGVLYDQERPLAAESLFAAGQELVKLNRQGEAYRVFDELVGRYPSSPLVGAARERLLELSAAVSGPSQERGQAP